MGKKNIYQHPGELTIFDQGPSLLHQANDKCKSISSSVKTVELDELAVENTVSYFGRYWTGSRRFNK